MLNPIILASAHNQVIFTINQIEIKILNKLLYKIIKKY